ncbi:MAG: hypothetical protein AAF378_14260 [Cyanobacteria bacterium P01_A01_bin.84]
MISINTKYFYLVDFSGVGYISSFEFINLLIMIVDFVSTKVDLTKDTVELCKAIEIELEKYGEPLRWAVTAVDLKNGKVIVEGVVTNW